MENIGVPQVKFGDWISEGWRMFTEQWKAWVLNMTVFFAVCILPIMLTFVIFYGFFFSSIIAASQASSRSGGTVPPPAVGGFIVFYGIFFLVWLFTLVAQAYLMGGMHSSALKQLRGGTIEFRDLLSGGKTFLPVLGATFLTGILVSIGSVLCIVPGLLALGCLFFTVPLIVDRGLGVIEAMQTSYALTKKNIWMFMLFALVVFFLASAGSYACYIGLLASYPLFFTITAVAYRDCFGMEGARRFLPNAPPTPGGYGQQPMGNIYQPPPPYGQGGYNQPPYPPPQQGYNPPPPQSYNPQPDYPPAPPNFVQPPPAAPNYPPPEPRREMKPTEQIPKPAIPQSAEPPVQNNPGSSTINCAKCNMSLPATAVFCPRCGTRTKP